MQRRDFLKGSAALGVSTLTGCCGTISAPPIDSAMIQAMQTDMKSGSINAFLAPETINAGQKLTEKIIDTHAHIYNASDWQIAGGLRGPFANSQHASLRPLLGALANPIEDLSLSVSLTAQDEMEKLNQWAQLPIDQARQAAIDYSLAQDELIADALFGRLSGTTFELVINQFLRFSPTFFTSAPYTEMSPEFFLDAFNYSVSNNLDAPAPSNSVLPDFSQGQGIIGFLYHLLSPRFKNLLAYQNAYTSSSDSIGVDQCYAAVVDFDYWIGNCDHAVSRLQDQIILMARIAQLSGGYMQPLVAYNPWTDINDDDDSIQLVTSAITDYGFAGVKIYPQLGYYPSNNAGSEYPDDGEHPDLGLLDAKLEHFFSVCRRLDVPVMAHSADSMGRKESHNKLGSPDAWNSFFSDPVNAGTRINLAHMGGDENGPDGTNWTARFTDTMKNPNASLLYGDFGVWNNLIVDDPKAIMRMISLLSNPVSNGQTVADRFMFGTDWLMLSFKGAWRQYASKFQQVLLDAGVEQEVLDKIMFRNAEALFKSNT